jgi:hypothetical protein
LSSTGAEFRYVVQLGKYGLPYVESTPDADLNIRHTETQIIIAGNRQGLLQLAKHLIALAEFNGKHGFHMHLDPGLQLDSESESVTLWKSL